MEYFEEDRNWTKETCHMVSIKTGLTESQVYKWGWDQKKKLEMEYEVGKQKTSVDNSCLKSGTTKKDMMSDKLKDVECSQFRTNEAKTDILTPIQKNEDAS